MSHSIKQQQQQQKSTFEHVRPAKIQISLRIRAVWSESSLCAFWIAKDTDQTTRVHRLLSLRWAHMSEGTFSDVTAQIL